jgi:hypothetical protein
VKFDYICIVKRSSSFLSGVLLIVLYFLIGNAAISANSHTDFSTPTAEKEASSFKAVSNALYCFTEPKGASVNYTPNPVVPVCKTLSKFFGGITTDGETVLETSSVQYHNFLCFFPIPFRALDLLFPSHYFW